MFKKTRSWSLILLSISVFALTSGCSKQTRMDRHLKKAEQYFASKEYNKAEVEYLNVLRVDHLNAKAIQRLGLIYFDEGSPLRAYSLLLKAKELAPDDLEVRLRLGHVYASAGESTNARNEAITILGKSPADEDAVLLLVDASVTTNEVNDAKQRLQKLRANAGDRAAFHLATANLLLRNQDMASAEKEIIQALVLDPKSRGGHLGMARLFWFRTNLAQADQEFRTAAELSALRSPTRLRYAEFKAQTGTKEEAKKLLREITAKAPDYLPAWSMLAQVAYAEKEYAEAIGFLERVLRVDQLNFDSRLLLAQVRLAQRQPAKAVEALESLNRLYAKVPQFKYQLAVAHLQNSNVVQATTALDQAVALKPDFAEAALLRAEISLGKGDGAGAAAMMQELLKKRPDVAQARLLLARAYQALNRPEDAANVYRGLMKAYPKNPQPPFLLGLVLRQLETTTEARAAFGKALELAPQDLIVISQLVDLDIAEKKFPAALARVQDQIQKDPKSAGAKFLEGRIYAAQSDWDKAEAALLKTLDLDATFSGAYYTLAMTYRDARKLTLAAGQLETLISKKPTDQRALMLLAMVYNEMKDYDKARKNYEKLLGINSNFLPALNNLAYLCAEQLGQLDKAYEFARKARDLRPDNPAIADTLGWILYKRGDYQQAQPLIRESAEKLPGNPEIQYHSGMIFYRMGQTDSARAALQLAVKSTELYPGKDEAVRRLAFLDNEGAKPAANTVAGLEKRLKEDPNDVPARMRLGELYEQQHAPDKAAKIYEEVLSINPKAAPAVVKLAQLNAGPLQNRSKAFEWAKKARSLAPTDPNVAHALGSLVYQSGDFPWAYSLLQEAAQQQATRGEVLYDLAWAAYSLGRVGEAQTSMEQALKSEPQFPHAADAKRFVTMTALAENPKALAQSEAEAQQALKLDANYVPALLVLATVQSRRGDAKSAAQSYEKVLTRFAQFAPAQKALAALYADDPATEKKAYDLAVKARQVLADDIDVAKTLGKLGYRRKDYRYAVQLLQESARAQDTDAESFYYLGMAHYQLKEKAQSKEALQRALSLNLQAKLGDEARRVITEMK